MSNSNGRWRSSGHGLFLLFAKGKRPDRHAMRRFIDGPSSANLSYDPLAGSPLRVVSNEPDEEFADTVGNGSGPPENRPDGGLWMELLRDGLTFDLEGLGPADPVDLPGIEHRFDFDIARALGSYEAVRIIPGEHLVGGESTMPVVRCLISIARDLANAFEHLEAVVWPPAKSVIGSRFFESTSTAWLEGGAFPALGLTSFFEFPDGGLQTLGLDYFIGQELRIEPPLGDQKVEATRLGIRLVNQLVLIGGLETSERVTAPDGTQMELRPSQNGKIIQVFSE